MAPATTVSTCKAMACPISSRLDGYDAVRGGSAISAFRIILIERGHGALILRSQRRRSNVDPDEELSIIGTCSAVPTHLHPWPGEAGPRHHPSGEPGALAAPAGISSRGARRNPRPTATSLHRHASAMDVGAVQDPTIHRS